MPNMRDEQYRMLKIAFMRSKLPLLTTRVTQRLIDMELLGGQAGDSEQKSESDPAGIDESERKLIRREIEKALGYEITGVDAITQFVSYSFMIGPHWIDNDEIKLLLEDQSLSEYDRLLKVHHKLLGI